MPDRSAPRWYIAIKRVGRAASVPLPDDVRVLSLKFEDDEAKTDKLTLTVSNYDLAQFDSDLWNLGNTIEFQFGYPGNMSPQREAVIQAVKGWDPLTVEADSKDALMTRKPGDRVFENLTRSEVVRNVVETYGYSTEQQHIEDTKVVLKHVTQGPMTDLQFIKTLAMREGFEFWVDFQGVHFKRRDTKQKPRRSFGYFVGEGGDIIGMPSVEMEKRAGKPGGVTLKGKDAKTGEAFEVRADNTTTGGDRTGLADNILVHGTEAEQIEIVNDFGETHLTSKPAVAESAEEHTSSTSEESKAAAQRAANGVFAKQQLRGATVSFRAIGDPGFLAKSVCALEGVGKRLSGNWYCKTVTHDLSASDYTMSVKLSRDGVNGAGVPNAAAKNALKADAQITAGEGGSGSGGGSRELSLVEVIDQITGESTNEQRYVEGS